ILAAGIAVENKEKGRVYDRFRDRIMFPIIDMRGRVTGFGGRVMDDSLPKYLNTSDSPVFNKSTTLYGINRTKKVRPLEFLIIVEGYMDVIALHRFGFPQAVASLGTSLTMEQAKLMRRLASEVYIAYDGDTAGQAATLRGLDILKEAGCKVRVMQFPQGMDPDEVLARYGPEYFKKLMAQSFPLIGYKFEMLKSKYDLSTQSGGMDACKEGCEILAKVDNEIEREVYIPQLEAITGIRQEAIRAQIKKIRSANEQNNLKRNISGNNRNTRDKKSLKILHSSQTKAEMYLINLMAQGETAAAKVVEGLEDISPEGSLLNETADIVKGLLERGREVNGAQILSHMQDEAKAKKLIEIFNIEMEYDNIDNFISDCLDMVAVGILESKRQNIQNEITRMDQEGISDPDKYRMLLKQLKDINAEIKFRQTRKEGSS
ncbi:MAG TPA: toprim domain-containing protein, partial [Candidatus Atribacteria bacterium]|nr:toprim domain-containing protein [Candidatus Atribacteria bacterium]